MARRRGSTTLLGSVFGFLFGGKTKPAKRKPAKPKAPAKPTAKPKREAADDLDTIARRLERGEIRGDALRELFASGKARAVRRNPRGKRR